MQTEPSTPSAVTSTRMASIAPSVAVRKRGHKEKTLGHIRLKGTARVVCEWDE